MTPELLLGLLSFLFGGGAFGYVLVIERRLTRLEVLAEETAKRQEKSDADLRIALGWTRRRADQSQPVPTLPPEVWRPGAGDLAKGERRE
jgi:hypothetical protein